MKVENLVSIVFTEDEVIEGMKLLMQCEMNDCVSGTPEHDRKENLINHLHNTTARVELDEGKFMLLMDGIAKTEEF